MSTQSRSVERSPILDRPLPVSRPSRSSAYRLLRSRAAFETALIVGAFVAHLALLPHIVSGDGLRRYNELNDLLAHGQISGDKYSLIGPLFATPLWLLGHIYRDPMWWVARFNLVIFGLGLLGIYWALKDRVDRRLVRTFLLILAIESLFPVALTGFYGETFTAIGVGVGALLAVFGRRLRGAAAVVLGVANTPATLIGLGFASVMRVLQSRRIWPIVVVLAAGALILAERVVRFHSLIDTHYEPGFTFPLLLGILSILFSFGKGLIFFTPGLLLPIRRRLWSTGTDGIRLYQVYILWIAFTVGMVLVYARWYDWSGDWYWGPRFFLLATIPASLALAVHLRHPSASLRTNLAVLGVLALSAWVGINSVVFSLIALAGPCGTLPSGLCVYVPWSSALWYPLVSPHLTPGVKVLVYLAFALVVFVYLAAPLVVTIIRQLREAARRVWVAGFADEREILKPPALPRYPHEHP